MLPLGHELPLEELLKQCRFVLSLDDDDDETEIPQRVVDVVRAAMTLSPLDDNWVLELGGGQGFGTITCKHGDERRRRTVVADAWERFAGMEESCYCDVMLT